MTTHINLFYFDFIEEFVATLSPGLQVLLGFLFLVGPKLVLYGSIIYLFCIYINMLSNESTDMLMFCYKKICIRFKEHIHINVKVTENKEYTLVIKRLYIRLFFTTMLCILVYASMVGFIYWVYLFVSGQTLLNAELANIYKAITK